MLHLDVCLQAFPSPTTFSCSAESQLHVGSASRQRVGLGTRKQLWRETQPTLSTAAGAYGTYLCPDGNLVPSQGDLSGDTDFKQSPEQLLPFLRYSKIKGTLQTWEVKGLY